jgi:hypothetical protein
MKNVHIFDGKINHNLKNIELDYDMNSVIQEMINLNWSDKVNNHLNIILSRSGSNVDYTDNLNIEDLLFLVWEKIKHEPKEYEYVWEQLEDISMGTCLQGFSKRLFSCYKALYEL